MRVVGLDPGISTTGYAAVERGANGDLVALDFGVWRTDPRLAQSLRLADLAGSVAVFLAKWQPEAAAVERLFFNSNVRTAMAVGQASGVLLAEAARAGVEVFDYTPPNVKLSVAGFGGADKKQVQSMVVALLHLDAPPTPPDAADACALAICHLNSGGLRRAIAAAART